MFISLISSTCIAIVFMSFGIPIVVGREPKCESNKALPDNILWKCRETKKCRLADKIPAKSKISCGVQSICCPEALIKPASPRPPVQTQIDEAKLIALNKCHEYGSYRYHNHTIEGVLIGDPPIKVHELDCADLSTIITGPDVLRKEYPFLALLGFDDDVGNKSKWHCGGTLVSEQFILSAAHCSKAPGNTVVKWALLGKLSRSEISLELRNKNLFKIVARINHPMYKPGSANNDIALFKLETPVRLSSSMRPVCLYESESRTKIPENRAEAAGWKSSLKQVSGDEDLDHAERSSIHILDDKVCIDKFKNDTSLRVDFDNNTMICGGDGPYYKSKSLIDGSPIMVTIQRCLHLQIGILSHRYRDDNSNKPEIYTRVSYFLSWIRSVVWRK